MARLVRTRTELNGNELRMGNQIEGQRVVYDYEVYLVGDVVCVVSSVRTLRKLVSHELYSCLNGSQSSSNHLHHRISNLFAELISFCDLPGLSISPLGLVKTPLPFTLSLIVSDLGQ